jgi:hypothetical protein
MLKPVHRVEFAWMLRDLGCTGTAVEVGVAEGKFAKDFLAVWPGKYVMVDRWCHIEGYDDVMNGPDEEHEIRYRQAMDVAAPHKDRVAVLRMDSAEAAATFADGSLDFVYLDGDHSFQGVMRDLAAWVPKVRPGGVIAGHDYYDKQPFAVRSAVRTFFNGPCGITHEASPSWWVLVPQ